MSKEITDKIDAGDLSMKPGWIRLSLHPTMTNDELLFITDAIRQTVENADEWKKITAMTNILMNSITANSQKKRIPVMQTGLN